MRYKEIINIIVNIEKNIPVDKIEYKELKIWPIIRLNLWRQLSNPIHRIHETKLNQQNKQKNFKFIFTKKIYNGLKLFIQKVKILIKIIKLFFKLIRLYYLIIRIKYKNTNTLFVTTAAERRVKVNNEYYNPFLHSLQEILDEEKIESMVLDVDKDKNKVPVYGDTIFIDDEVKYQKLKNELKCRLRIFLGILKKEEISYWKNLDEFMKFNYPDIVLHKPAIINEINSILNYQKIFEKILKKIKPKVCFFCCYYRPLMMGLIKACWDLKIKSVEIQHGQQGDYHGMYTNWTKLPIEGYNTLPSDWRCWGKKSADRINKWSQKIHPLHKAFIGGNTWVSKHVNKKGVNNNIFRNFSDKIKVFVSLQPNKNPLSSHLLEAIKLAPKEIYWLISLHPNMLNRKEEIANTLKQIQTDNYDIVLAANNQLFNILRQADFVVTQWSSVAYEALLFKTHPIIIHSNGLDAFKNYIENGLFSYATTGKEILNILSKNKNQFNFNEEEPYIIVDRNKINRSLNLLFNKS